MTNGSTAIGQPPLKKKYDPPVSCQMPKTNSEFSPVAWSAVPFPAVPLY